MKSFTKRTVILVCLALATLASITTVYSWTFTTVGRVDIQTALIRKLANFIPDKMLVSVMLSDEARSEINAYITAGQGPLEPVATIKNLMIPGSEVDIPVRIYTPDGTGPWPIIVYYHGGGFAIGDLDTVDGNARTTANTAAAIVVSVDYRLAPENPYPAATTDAFDALRWVYQHATSFGGDPQRMAVMGESAGATLAAVAALKAVAAGTPILSHQVLVYPMTDSTGVITRSLVEASDIMEVDSPMMRAFGAAYSGFNSEVLTEPDYSVLYAPSHEGLPSTTIVLAEQDPLRADGKAYARKLKEAGVQVETHYYAGVMHGFYTASNSTEGADARKKVARALKNSFRLPIAADDET